MQFTKDQEAAINAFKAFLSQKEKPIMVIEGSAGTGKSFLTKYLIDFVSKYNEMQKLINPSAKELGVLGTATTHKATSVFADKANIEVNTIHSALGIRPHVDYSTGDEYFKRNPNKAKLRDTLVFVDESSLICSKLVEKILEGVGDTCRIVFIGDPNQLPPIKNRKSIVFDGSLPMVSLREVVRQQANSGILALANQYLNTIQTGKFPKLVANGVDVLHVDGPEFQQRILQEFQQLK